MLAIFCLRLAGGLIGALVLFPPRLVNPRFYRTHFLTALGLSAGAAVALRGTAGAALWAALAGGMVLAFAGSLVWSLEGAPAGKLLIGLTLAALTVGLGLASRAQVEEQETARAQARLTSAEPGSADTPVWVLADDLTSAALLGTATTAMLMGHSYLIAPSMSLTPLLRLLAGLFTAVLLRGGLAGWSIWSWTAGHSLVNLEGETVLWLPVRWGVGLAAPLVLGWMARESAKIRSTQSATGILYVVVICVFLGELTSQLLAGNTGSSLL
jgi:hypothetical protein